MVYDARTMKKLVCCFLTLGFLAGCGGGAPRPVSSAPAKASSPASEAAAKPPASSPASAAAKPAASADAAAKPAQGSKFTVPYTAYSGAFTALWVAADENFFAKQGFDVTVQYMDAPVAASALLSGETPFSSTPSIVNSIVAGGDAVILAKLVSYPKFSLYATSAVQKVEDLKGKTLADTQRGTAPDNAVRDLLTKHGVKETDLQWAYFPNPTAALAAMVAGQAAAGILPAPTTAQARSQGFHEVTDTATEMVPGIAAAVSTKRARTKDNPQSVRSYLMALKEATAFAKNNPDRTKAIIGKYAKTDVAAEMEETYRAYEPTWTLAPVTAEDIAVPLKYSSDPRAAAADPKNFFDSSFVQSL
jgi:NitT/TauT family transport system substrate-binding protein